MSLLEQQLKELQTKKCKVEYFKTVLSLLSNQPLKKQATEADAAESEANLEIEAFINKRIAAIEDGGGDEMFDSSGPHDSTFSPEEIDVLKQIATRALERTGSTTTQAQAPAPVTPQPRRPASRGAYDDEGETEELPPARPQQQQQRRPLPPQKKAAREDKVAFALNNRHLDQKRCSVTSSNGNKALGKIVGTDAPFLVVQLDTGHTINVPPEEVEIG